MDLFSIDLSLAEIRLLRQSLDVITITGKDAQFIASIQTKLESELHQIANMLQEAENAKQLDLERAMAADARKQKKAEQPSA